MTLHGQLRNQKGALHRAWPPPGSLSHGGRHRTVLLPRVGACSSRDHGAEGLQQDPAMARAACHAALARGLRQDALAPCPIPGPQGRGTWAVFLEVKIQRLSTTVRPDTFYKFVSQGLFFSFCLGVFSSSFIFYILSPQNKNVSMSNVLYREGECRSRGIPAPDVTWRGSTAGGKGGSTTGHALKLKCDQNKQTK